MSNKSKALIKGILPFFLFNLTLSNNFSLSQDKDQKISIDTKIGLEYIRLNNEEGIIYKERNYSAIKSNLYIDKNTLNSEYPSTKLELTALLDLQNTKVGIFNAFILAKRLKIRDSPIIIKDDFVKNFRKISRDYENEDDYTKEHTEDLVSLLDEGLLNSYEPGCKLVIENSDKLLIISSYNLEGDLIENSKKKFNDRRVNSYLIWIQKRMNEDFEEIQDETKDGRETHLAYIKKSLETVTANK